MNLFSFVPTNSGAVMVHAATGATYTLTRDDVILLIAQAANAIASSPRVPTPQPTLVQPPPFVPGPVDPKFADTNAWNAYLESLKNKPYIPPQPQPAPQPSTGGTTGGDFKR